MVDEAEARLRLAHGRTVQRVEVRHIEEVVARIARIPPKTVSSPIATLRN